MGPYSYLIAFPSLHRIALSRRQDRTFLKLNFFAVLRLLISGLDKLPDVRISAALYNFPAFKSLVLASPLFSIVISPFKAMSFKAP